MDKHPYLKKIKMFDLFSGIGGFSLGFEATGFFETVGFCEVDPYCSKLLALRWPGIKNYGDVRNVKGDNIGQAVDVICGGFPCQPFSLAGKRRGKEDDRDLWPEMFRVIKEVRPAWVVGENVANFANMELERSCLDLEAQGYEVQTFIIPACGVNAPHKRYRTWIIAHADSFRQIHRQSEKQPAEAGVETFGDTATVCGNVFYSDQDNEPRMWPEQHCEATIGLSDRENREWRKDGLEVAAQFCGVDDGISDRLDRLGALGNAIVPQIAQEIGYAIAVAEGLI